MSTVEDNTNIGDPSQLSDNTELGAEPDAASPSGSEIKNVKEDDRVYILGTTDTPPSKRRKLNKKKNQTKDKDEASDYDSEFDEEPSPTSSDERFINDEGIEDAITLSSDSYKPDESDEDEDDDSDDDDDYESEEEEEEAEDDVCGDDDEEQA